VLLEQIKADVKYTFTSPDTKANGLGAMSLGTWEKTINTLVDQGVIKQSTDAAKTFTDKYQSAAKAAKF
jgi:hypothetical protein